MSRKKSAFNSQIAVNKKAFHDYFIEEKIEAGISLEGWEVKSIRAGKAQIKEAYVTFKEGEAFLFGAHISPLMSASTHVRPDPIRTRKLLLHKHEIDRLIGSIDRKGYTIVPLSLYWKTGMVKAEIGLARGKKEHDKRATTKEREWNIEKHRVLKGAE